jgi:hypothetical protein
MKCVSIVWRVCVWCKYTFVRNVRLFLDNFKDLELDMEDFNEKFEGRYARV